MDTKQSYYSDIKVVADYEHKRFGRGGGQFVASVERDIVAGLLRMIHPQGATLLDCPTGTGRFLTLANELGFDVIAVDISPAMLDQAKRYPARSYILASAGAIPLSDGSVDAWLMSRFAFHYRDLGFLFKEAMRLVRPGGFLIFDVYRWTPRTWIPGSQSFFGGRVFTHRRKALARELDRHGFSIVRTVPAFVLAPYLYGFVPMWLARMIECLGNLAFPSFKSKAYLFAQRRED
jgi:SAM-dependent methyltransferase